MYECLEILGTYLLYIQFFIVLILKFLMSVSIKASAVLVKGTCSDAVVGIFVA